MFLAIPLKIRALIPRCPASNQQARQGKQEQRMFIQQLAVMLTDDTAIKNLMVQMYSAFKIFILYPRQQRKARVMYNTASTREAVVPRNFRSTCICSQRWSQVSLPEQRVHLRSTLTASPFLTLV